MEEPGGTNKVSKCWLVWALPPGAGGAGRMTSFPGKLSTLAETGLWDSRSQMLDPADPGFRIFWDHSTRLLLIGVVGAVVVAVIEASATVSDCHLRA